MTAWCVYGPERDDETLVDDVLLAYQDILATGLHPALTLNRDLPIEIRALRHTGNWRVFLLLTPWHLARVFVPKEPPAGLEPPEEWGAEQRSGAPYAVIGPAFQLDVLGGTESAHLNFDPRLGHFFLQPLIQNMRPFRTADTAFAAWHEVIRVRDRNMAEFQKRCPWQEQVSRREFFARLVRRIDPEPKP